MSNFIITIHNLISNCGKLISKLCFHVKEVRPRQEALHCEGCEQHIIKIVSCRKNKLKTYLLVVLTPNACPFKVPSSFPHDTLLVLSISPV